MPPVRSKDDPPGIVSSQQTVNARLWPKPATRLICFREAATDPKEMFVTEVL